MKITRRKRVQRYLRFYKNQFHFRPPFQILIDGTFCQAALKFKINIKEQMPKYLDSEVKLLTTACVVTEIEKLGPPVYGAMVILKQYSTHQCGHEKSPLAADKCLKEMIKRDNNSQHYMLATLDSGLADMARQMAGVPLLYIQYNAIIMEKPSEASEEKFQRISSEKFQLTPYQKEVLKELGGDHQTKEINKPKKRKIKGPNPLSCKKKKKKLVLQSQAPAESKRKRKRTRLKIPKHVKEEFAINRNIV